MVVGLVLALFVAFLSTAIHCGHVWNACMIETHFECFYVQRESATAQPPPPKQPSFSCPICMGPLVEEMSTKCGHIFCKACVKAAITAQGKCPVCRKKVLMKELIRVFLPSTCWAMHLPRMTDCVSCLVSNLLHLSSVGYSRHWKA